MSASLQSAPEHLTAERLSSLRQRMQSHLDQLLARDAELRAQLSTDPALMGNTVVASTEGAAASASEDQAIALMHHEQAEVVALRDALARMDSGHYGWCGECGDAIGVARLDAMPEARLCIRCQDALEHVRPT